MDAFAKKKLENLLVDYSSEKAKSCRFHMHSAAACCEHFLEHTGLVILETRLPTFQEGQFGVSKFPSFSI